MRRLVGVLLLAIAAACAGRVLPPNPPAPLFILVSLDGWRFDYDTKAPAPNLRELAARGVAAAGLIPAYPSKTVPNHYSIVTGLYPGHHGMIANVIRDPATGRLVTHEYRVEGLATCIEFHRRVMAHPAFVHGDLHTGFLDEHRDLLAREPDPEFERLAAIAAAVAHLERRRLPAAETTVQEASPGPSAWRRSARWSGLP